MICKIKALVFFCILKNFQTGPNIKKIYTKFILCFKIWNHFFETYGLYAIKTCYLYTCINEFM